MKTHKSGVLIALVAIMALILPMTSVLAITGSTFEGNDGNLVVTTPGNTDWTNVTNKTVQADLATGTGDNSFGEGSKENDINIHVGTGSIPNSKADLGRFASAFQFIGGNLYLQLAWTRNNLSGTVNFDFEINKLAQPDLTTIGDKVLNRSTGDVLITYDFDGGAQHPTLGLRRWLAAGIWGPNTALSAAVAEAEVNRGGPVSDGPIGGSANVPAFAFGEANINLTAAGVVQANACNAFSSIYVKSRSSTAFSATMKDFIAPTPVNISNCGTVTVIKHTSPAALDQAFAFTSNVAGTGSPDTTGAAFSLNDSGVDTQTFTAVPIGSYTITEGDNPAGFAFNNVDCDVTGSATESTAGKVATVGIVAGGDTVTCTYTNDQQLGAIKITKTSSKGANPGLAGAVFTITPPGGGTAFDVTTATGGVICTDNLTFGTYAVVEKTPPTGYAIDDTTSHNVVVDTNADCDDATGQATFSATDTPTSRIHVSFDDEGSGATSATISCDNTTGTTTTPSETGWDTTTQVTGIHAPVTVVCTIVIDP